MKRKTAWLVLSGLMVLSLVITSCGQAPTTPKAPTSPTTTATQTAPAAPAPTAPTEEKKAAPTVEKPKYGGVLRVVNAADVVNFDEIVGYPYTNTTFFTTNESLLSGDWTKGPAGGYGSNEASWSTLSDRWDQKAGRVAESWELPSKMEGETAAVIYHIRKGIRWALNPNSEASRLVSGREVTADDVVFSLKQNISDKRAFLYNQNPELRPAKITAVDKSTVKVEFPWAAFESAVSRFGDNARIVPPEVIQKLGDMNDWKRSVGTGPFMLTEVVPGSGATFVRNPNYWMKDPIGPGKGNQLPYLDGVKILVITDASTRYAAFRTAKIDQISAVDWEEAGRLRKANPQLKSSEYQTSGAGNAIGMRIDKVPFNDVRVRRAMLMSIDFEGIKNKLYSGNAQILTWPVKFIKEYGGAYIGLDDPEMPESVRELYSYNPEKAKKLLSEAGYPNGFKTWVNYTNTAEATDYFSVLKDMWAKVGVQAELRPMESGAKETMRRQKTHEQMMDGIGATPVATLYKMNAFRGITAPTNVSMVNDPIVNDTFEKIQIAMVTSQTEADRLHRELMKHVLGQAWAIPQVQPPEYTLWWPWLKNYSGELNVGYIHRQFYNWVWIDEALKKSMGY
ncbi:MAG: ABC transporter substrate-binding protein [Chloroflexi bacterium]|nr:ABC transporter substrate-binding protein [Chloroflexota bacterium]